MGGGAKGDIPRRKGHKMAVDSAMAARLVAAREYAGYATTTAAAEAMGVKVATYTHHENATRGFTKRLPRYAHFFLVNIAWLAEGSGAMTGSHQPPEPDRSAPLDPIALVELIRFSLIELGVSNENALLWAEALLEAARPPRDAPEGERAQRDLRWAAETLSAAFRRKRR
jgi:hypothetical protein